MLLVSPFVLFFQFRLFCVSVFCACIFPEMLILFFFFSASVVVYRIMSPFFFQESEEDKKDRLLRELSDDTKVQKKKPWYGLF